MRDKMGLSKVELFPKNVMGKIALLHNTVFKKRVQRGEDKDGHRFKPYTMDYTVKKSNDFISEKTGKRYKYPRAPIASNKIYPPDLTLTGHMMRNLKRRSYNKTEWVLGFDGENAEKAQGNADHGRNIIDNIPNKEKDILVKLLGKEIDKQFGKLKNVTITIGK